MEKLYRIEEEQLTGWYLVEQGYSGMTKEEAQQKWEFLLRQGYNPNSLRIVREQ
jgi:hypothetical protein